MTGKPILIMPLLVAALVFEVSASGGCPAGKGTCMNSRYCKGGQSHSSKQHKCILPNMKHGVCCNGCTTTRGGPGICVAAENCVRYTRDFLLDQKMLNEGQWWKTPNGVCYETKHEKYYCCPTGLPKRKSRSSRKVNIIKPWDDNAFPSCQTRQQQPGRCVPLKLCDNLFGKYISYKTRRQKYELLRDSQCPSNHSRSVSVCCQKPQNPDSLIRISKAKRLGLDQCGKISMTNKILGGKEADLQQFPWMVNIMYHRKNKFEMIKVTLCSGTLIHPKYLLTAAHCSKPGFKPISVRLGEYDLSKKKDCVDQICSQQFIERYIEKWISHEKFNKITGKADIALVKLATAAKIIPGQILPICLPLTEKWLMTKPTELTVSGWGLMGNQRLPDVLMHAELKVLDRSTYCQNEDVFCTRGADMEGHCPGDSGGPLQQIMPWGNSNRMVLFGLVSRGAAECSKENTVPGVSTLVGYYLYWILDKMEI